jgi:hypothetical protein
MIAIVVACLYGFLYYPLMNTAQPSLIVLATVLAFVFHAFVYVAARGADRRMLHPATALQRHLDRLPAPSITAGGPAPLIATALLSPSLLLPPPIGSRTITASLCQSMLLRGS